MEDGQRLTPVEYLDRLFDVIREEARDNAGFAARLVRATGGEVVFGESEKPALLNPLEIAALAGETGVAAAFASFDPAELRRVLKAHHLATAVDIKARSRDELLDMLARRSTERARARTSTPQSR